MEQEKKKMVKLTIGSHGGSSTFSPLSYTFTSSLGARALGTTTWYTNCSNHLSDMTKYPLFPAVSPHEFSTLYRTGLPDVSRCTQEMTIAWVMEDSFTRRRSALLRPKVMSKAAFVDVYAREKL